MLMVQYCNCSWPYLKMGNVEANLNFVGGARVNVDAMYSYSAGMKAVGEDFYSSSCSSGDRYVGCDCRWSDCNLVLGV